MGRVPRTGQLGPAQWMDDATKEKYLRGDLGVYGGEGLPVGSALPEMVLYKA